MTRARTTFPCFSSEYPLRPGLLVRGWDNYVLVEGVILGPTMMDGERWEDHWDVGPSGRIVYDDGNVLILATRDAPKAQAAGRTVRTIWNDRTVAQEAIWRSEQ